MDQKRNGGSDSATKTYKHLYDGLLGRARGMAEDSRQRLRVLDAHFPQVLPEKALEPDSESRGGPATQERRAAPRCGGGQARVIVFAVATPEVLMARVDDWSQSGVGLWLSRPLETGSSLYILPDDFPETAAGALAEVRYCRPHGEGWAVGCRLVRTGRSAEQLFGARAQT